MNKKVEDLSNLSSKIRKLGMEIEEDVEEYNDRSYDYDDDDYKLMHFNQNLAKYIHKIAEECNKVYKGMKVK